MANVTDFLKTGVASVPNQVQVASQTVDFSLTNVVADDVVRLWEIPKGTYISAVWAQVVTAEGGTLTYDVGDDQAGADDYIDGANGNATAGTIHMGDGSTGGTLTTTVHSLYSASGKYLTLTPKNNADAAKITVYWQFADITGVPTVA